MKRFLMASLLVASAALAHEASTSKQNQLQVPQKRQQQPQKQQHQQQMPPLGGSAYAAFQDEELTTFVEEVTTPESVYSTEVCADKDGATDGISDIVSLDQIVNLGQKIWGVVEQGKPVLESKYSYANALPAGVKASSELDGWSGLQARSFRVHAKNGFGITVYDVTYTLVHRYGGNFGGKGKYLDAVTVLPQNISLMWGYKLGLNVNVISTLNVGTKEAPIGGLTLELLIKVSTVVKDREMRGLYDFRGDAAKVTIVQ